MIKKTVFLSLICCMLTACGGKDVKLTGKLEGVSNPTVYAVYESPSKILLDTLLVENGLLDGKQKELGFESITLYFNDLANWVVVYPEKKKAIKITGDVTDPASIRIKGGRTNNKLSQFRKSSESLIRQRDSLWVASKGDLAEDQELWRKVNLDLAERVTKFIKKNKDEDASVLVISHYLQTCDSLHRIVSLLDLLGDKVAQSSIVKDIKEHIAQLELTELDLNVPEFGVRDVFRKRVSSTAMQGKFTLLSFTKSFPENTFPDEETMKELAKSYHTDTLEMVSIVLNKNPHELRDILKKDTITWRVVSDSATQALELVELFNVSTFPFCYIIDKEGKIVLKTNKHTDIKETLEELIK